MLLLSNITANFRRFLADEDGAAAIEFLMSLPLLIGVLLFTSEYGNALRAKMVLNTATADAARLLARSPLQEDSGTGKLSVYEDFRTDAGNMVAGMIGGPVNISTVVYTPSGSFASRSDILMIRVTADASLTMPLLGFINNTLEWAGQFAIGAPDEPIKIKTTIPLSASQVHPWIGGSGIGAAECTVDLDGLTVCDEEAGS